MPGSGAAQFGVVKSVSIPKVICCICEHEYDRTATGALEEMGRGRRFCPDCSRDILLKNGIKDHHFILEDMD
jgi:hypothetical protein